MAVGAASRLMTLHGRCHVMQGLLCQSRSSSLTLSSPHRCCMLPGPPICPLNCAALPARLDTSAPGCNRALPGAEANASSCSLCGIFPCGPPEASGPVKRRGCHVLQLHAHADA